MAGELQVSQVTLPPPRPAEVQDGVSTMGSSTMDSKLEVMMDNKAEELPAPRPPRPIRPSIIAAVSNPNYSDLEVVVAPAAPPVPAVPVTVPQKAYYSDEKTLVDDKSFLNLDNDDNNTYNTYSSTGKGTMAMYDISPIEPAPAYVHGDNQPLLDRSLPRSDSYGIKGFVDQPPRNPTQPDISDFSPSRRERTYFGLSRTNFLLGVGALAFSVILAIVLGVVLGMSNRNHNTSSAKAGTAGILDNSRLAAVNWSDPVNGIDRTAVFWQHESNSLMVSLRDAVSNSWSAVNVTAAVMNGSQVTGLDVLPGTPLACVSNRFQLSLYYMTKSNQVAELYSPPGAGLGKQWLVGALQTSVQTQSAKGTQLSAYWQLCDKCVDSLIVLYQADTGVVRLANLTNGVWSQSDWVTEADAGTGLAINTFTDFRGTGPDGTNPNALRTYHADSGGLIETIMGPETAFKVQQGNFDKPLSSGLPTNPSPQIASITYGSNGWDNNLVTYLTTNGTMMSHVYRGKSWDVQPPNFTGGPKGSTNFTAIAATQSMSMHGLYNGRIYEYRTTQLSPFTWSYVGPVTA